MKKREKKLVAILIIIIIALIAYGIIPVVLSASPGSMHSGNTYYVYGTVDHRFEYDNTSVVQINDSGQYFYIYFNGSAPAVGAHILAHGKYNNGFLGKTISATSVYPWYYSL